MIRPSGIGEGLTLLSKADTKILHCIGRGLTNAKDIHAEIGLSTEQIYARALILKRLGILENRKGIHLAKEELPQKLASFLSGSIEKADILANMGIRFLMALREPSPGRTIANRTGVCEATYYKWQKRAAQVGIIVSENGLHRIDYSLWPDLRGLLNLIDTESRMIDRRIPDHSNILWMNGKDIIFSAQNGEPYQKTAFSAFGNNNAGNTVFYTTSDEPLNEQDLFDDAVHICESTDDPGLRLRTIDYLLDNLDGIIPDNDFIISLSRVVRGLDCKGWPDKKTLDGTFGDLSELIKAMIPQDGPRIPPDYRTETFKLQPNRTQKHFLESILNTCNMLQNELLDYFTPMMEEGIIPSSKDIRSYVVHELKRNSINGQLYRDVPATILQEVCDRVCTSLSMTSKNNAITEKNQKPNKRSKMRSFVYPQVGRGVSFPRKAGENRKIIRLAGVGEVRYDGHMVRTDGKRINSLGRRIPYENPVPGVMKRCRVVKDDTGQWFCQITYCPDKLSPERILQDHPRTPIGIDLGAVDVITTSEGEKIANFRELSRLKEKIGREQTRMNRCEPGSEEWEKHRKRIAHLYRHYRNRQRDDMHKLSLDLIKKHDLIVFEDINIKRLISKEKTRKLRFAQSEASWRKLTDMVDYKAAGMGTEVIYVDPRNTSQLCSECGRMVKKDLCTRIHHCPHCGLEIDRDINAAINILKRGYERRDGAIAGNRTRGLTLARSSVNPYTTIATLPHHSANI